jgi:hypothetical protein
MSSKKQDPRKSKGKTIPEKEEDITMTTEGDVTEEEATEEDVNNENITGVNRSLLLIINNINETQNYVPNENNEPKFSFDKNEGTPQKRILFLLEQIKYTMINIYFLPQNTFETKYKWYGKLLNDLQKLGRKDLIGTINKYPDLNKLINDFINLSLKNNKKAEGSSSIILTWIEILIKSISDVSLFGSLINLIEDIYKKDRNNENLKTYDEIKTIIQTPSSSVNKRSEKVKTILKGNINLAFFSSDLITAALSTNLGKLIAYPIPILSSTKRSGITTQTIIIQKNVISTLGIILSYISDIDKIVELQEKMNNIDVTNFLQKIIEYMLKFYEKLGEINTNISLDISNISDDIQKVFDELFIYQDNQHNLDKEKVDSLLTEVYELIYNISSIPKLIDVLNNIESILIQSEEQYIVDRWTYHLSNDIFKFKAPLYKDLFTKNNGELKKKISRAEILSATYDAMYGHDFPFEFIRTLGSQFLQQINETNVYNDMEKEVVASKLEHT